MDKKKIVK